MYVTIMYTSLYVRVITLGLVVLNKYLFCLICLLLYNHIFL